MSAADWMRANLAAMLGIDASRITDAARLEEDLGADSLDRLELVMTAEDHFKLCIGDDEIKGISTFGQAVALIDARVAALGAATSSTTNDTSVRVEGAAKL